MKYERNKNETCCKIKNIFFSVSFGLKMILGPRRWKKRKQTKGEDKDEE